jgi:hypothetical protein
MVAAPGPAPGVLAVSTGACVQGDSSTAVSAFLLDAARGGVSARTVLLVLEHWVSEGLSPEEIRKAIDVAHESCPTRHRKALDELGHAVLTRFG